MLHRSPSMTVSYKYVPTDLEIIDETEFTEEEDELFDNDSVENTPPPPLRRSYMITLAIYCCMNLGTIWNISKLSSLVIHDARFLEEQFILSKDTLSWRCEDLNEDLNGAGGAYITEADNLQTTTPRAYSTLHGGPTSEQLDASTEPRVLNSTAAFSFAPMAAAVNNNVTTINVGKYRVVSPSSSDLNFDIALESLMFYSDAQIQEARPQFEALPKSFNVTTYNRTEATSNLPLPFNFADMTKCTNTCA